jgi:hypothetical protein
MKRFAMITAAAFGALLATTPGALAQNPPDVNCPPYAGVPLTAHNVTVPDGQICNLLGVRVTGNVTVGNGAVLFAEDSTIAGNVQADHCLGVALERGVIVGGNVQIAHCTTDSGYVGDVLIGGDFQCHDNTAACFAEGGQVGGNVQVNNNVSMPKAPSEIFDNFISKNLQCQGNRPPPVGSGNTVAGNPEGQCATFTVTPY